MRFAQGRRRVSGISIWPTPRTGTRTESAPASSADHGSGSESAITLTVRAPAGTSGK